MVELSERVEKYIDVEEFIKTKDSGLADDGYARDKWKHEGPNRGSRKNPKSSQQRGKRDQAPMTFTPLSWPIQEDMAAAEAQNLLKK